MTKAKVLVVHLIPLLGFGVVQLLAGNDDFEVCDITEDASSARRTFEQHPPRIAIVGPVLRGSDGIQLIKDFHKMSPSTAILMLAAEEDGRFIRRALQAGARGYLRVIDAHRELIPALTTVSKGQHYVSTALSEAVYENFATRESTRANIDSLSDREREVFLLIGKGRAVSDVAAEMRLSENSVHTYLKRVKEKLGLKTSAQLREKAARVASKSAWRALERC
jgi:two-component system response regulator NreC